MSDWRAELLKEDGSQFMVVHREQPVAVVKWSQTGVHSVRNGLAAITAARHVGVTPDHAISALSHFSGVKRRMELLADVGGIRVYDDFAHHPTAIASTLDGLRKKVGAEPIVAVIEPRSNTMQQGVHQQTLLPSAAAADHIVWANLNQMDWLPELVAASRDQGLQSDPSPHHYVESTLEALIGRVAGQAIAPCHIVIMSNGGFGGIHQQLIAELERRSD